MKNVRRNSTGRASGEDAPGAEGGEHADSNLVQQLAKDISNVVFMDSDIPGLTATEAANILKAAYPDINVLLFSVRNNETAITTITTGYGPVPPPASLSACFAQLYEAAIQTNTANIQKVLTFFNRKPEEEPGQYGLSHRELQVLDCLVNGDTYKKIAEHCHISVGTVRSHIMNIYRKLDVNSRSAAIVKAMQERLVGS
jgi:DNA-binding NarL/FixJ family response regulator